MSLTHMKCTHHGKTSGNFVTSIAFLTPSSSLLLPSKLKVSACGMLYVVMRDDAHIARWEVKGDSPSGTRNAWTYSEPLLRVESGKVTFTSLEKKNNNTTVH